MQHPIIRVHLLVTLLFGSMISERAKAADPEDFYTQAGPEPTFEEVMESGKLPRGENSGRGFKGERIKINHEMLEDSPYADRRIIDEINIHTLGNSVIRRDDFPKWSRWYQEDGNTQIFRLFKGEENVRNSRKLAARIESFSSFGWKEGDGWQEWSATYTIIKPLRCAIFQAKNPINQWSVMINMNEDGDVNINPRTGEGKILGRNMVGKPFHIRIREDGHNFEVYFNGKKEGEGSYSRPKGETNFRWGMYVGAKEVPEDAMLLVTGAAINAKEDDEPAGGLVTKIEEEPEPVQIPPPVGKAIPVRTWTNRDGLVIKAEGRYEPGSSEIHFKVDGQWITYPVDSLSETDRKNLMLALEFIPDEEID